ncbi:MAG: HAMP domain-containing protein [Polyangiaceae bacterium]|nr:HAMP domain-containing protein [Polyangiaceae bacterium]MCW5790428.1 HAMP domain-containing protein [Polyangiaceae bacterium]
MTLAQRLMLAITVLTIAVTATLGFAVREAWRSTEEERFRVQFQEAVVRLDEQLSAEVARLPELVELLCRHDPTLDSTLIDLSTGRLDSGRRLAVSVRVTDLQRTLGVEELVLLTSEGEVLGAVHEALVTGSKAPELAAQVARPRKGAQLRPAASGPLALEAHCTRSRGRAWVGVYAARHLTRLLEDVGRSHGVTIRQATDSTPDPNVLSAELTVKGLGEALGDARFVATRSRVPLSASLEQLDLTLGVIGGGTLFGALLVAYLLARGLARPISDLSAEARRVVEGQPRPVRGRGGRELVELAEAFNQAIQDLAALRRRLAATERIAARREVARQVAHEIKNPLAPIRAAVETLRRLRARGDVAFDDYFDEATKTVLDEVKRINTIVSEFTRFARLPPPNPAPMDVAQAVRQVVGLHTEHDEAGVAIELSVEPCPTLVADRDQLVQVMTNLLQNAVDACRAEPKPRVTVWVRPLGHTHVEIGVADNGPGFAPEVRDRLFEPYVTTKEHGTGLGLAIVQRIVMEHGGDLYAEAGSPGAVLRFQLPLSGPTLLPEPPPSSRR